MEWQPPPGVDRLIVVDLYEGDLRDDVLNLKRGRSIVLPRLADALATEIRDAGAPDPGAIVTWVPTTPGRRRARGFDQSRLLAKAVARRIGLPSKGLLRRHGEAQQGRDAQARRSAPAFSARRSPAEILLLDDVTTTGASLTAAAAALRAAGATRVTAAVLAAVPARRRSAPPDPVPSVHGPCAGLWLRSGDAAPSRCQPRAKRPT